MNRIYDAMMQIKTGNFSYFISIFGFQQSARIVNAVYGPFLAYILGGILLLAGSWVKFQLITSFLINVIAALGIFRISHKLKASNLNGILAGSIYMSAYFLASWNYAGSFTGVGGMVLPWVLYYGIEMVNSPGRNFSALGLGIAMGLLLQTHVLSSLFATVALLPFVIFSVFTTNNIRKFFSKMFFSVIIAVLISLNVWTGFIHLMGSNTLLQTAPMDLLTHSINFFSTENNSQNNIGLVMTVLYLALLSLVLFNWRKVSVVLKFMIITGGVFLIISSTFFPWSILSAVFPALKSSLQFPSRLQVIPATLLIAACPVFIKECENADQMKSLKILLFVGAIMSLSTAQGRIIERMETWNGENVLASPNKKPDNITSEEMREILKNPDMKKILDVISKGTPDYLPVEEKVTTDEYQQFSPYVKYVEYIIDSNHSFAKIPSKDGLTVSWDSEKNEKVQVPIIKYRDTIVRQNGEEIEPELTEIGSIIVDSVNGKNTIHVSYNAPKYVYFSVIISIVSFAATIILVLFRSIGAISKKG